MSLFGSRSKWRKVIIDIGAVEWDELNVVAWDMADVFWQANEQPSLYFARYSVPPVGDSRIEIQTEWSGTDDELRQWFAVQQGVVSVTLAGTDGSDAHAAAYLLARQLRGKGEALTKDTMHWMLNMVGYSYAQEIKLIAEHAAVIAGNLEHE